MPTAPICPDCDKPLTPTATVVLTLEIAAGDEMCGQTSSTRVPLCATCAKNLANRYAAAAQRFLATVGT